MMINTALSTRLVKWVCVEAGLRRYLLVARLDGLFHEVYQVWWA